MTKSWKKEFWEHSEYKKPKQNNITSKALGGNDA